MEGTEGADSAGGSPDSFVLEGASSGVIARGRQPIFASVGRTPLRGYGEKFRNLNGEDSGGGELDDVVAGAQYLIDRRPEYGRSIISTGDMIVKR
jgi:hypothetical protein